ncbi:MAG TPA: ABC-F family ATP-binding cassette domain-containing protein [Tepidisphaeraceae bacterium]|jgi:ATP-binding cassette subfamily F protein uup|nr:ABC-F family ATP-binding cassette domain-containing protein [Tepidisphaeraceae bacterium]
MALLQSIKNLSKSFGVRPLFRGINISFDDTERTGLIGPNGAGKSTLLKILAGIEAPDEGTLEGRRNLRLGYLAQADEFPAGQTVEGAMLAAVADVPGDEHEHHVDISILLDKVGFKDVDQKANTLSGGWKKRLAVAQQLIRKPDLLLLDEPTNHLDLDGILWLERLLLSSKFAFVTISHDRAFLERVTNRTVELSRSYADGYLSISGPYSAFVEKRAEYLAAQSSRQQSLASQVRGEIEWLRRGPKARGTKAKGRIQQAGEMMTDLAELKTRNNQGGTAQIDFSATARQTRKLINVERVAKTLGDRKLLTDISFVLAPGTKLGLIGPNGSGKSTLIRLLSGQLEPDAGTIRRADALKVVVFDQNRAQLDPMLTLRDALSPTGDTVYYAGGSQHVTGWAQRFLFRTEQLDLPVGQLSGGEKARVMIARMMLEPADVLILDEPTNDLDIPSLGVIEQSLDTFPGALVLVTHDRFMLERLTTDILGLDGRGNANLVADVDQYLQWRETQAATKSTPARQATGNSASKPAAKPSVNPSLAPTAATKKLSYMEQRELDGIEAKIHTAEAALATAEAEAHDPKLAADWQKSHDLFAQVETARQQVQKLYARWEELESRRQ